jgi:pilus assembly protein Flp/PilA
MKELLQRLWQDDTGQDIAEYAILLAVITLVVVVAVSAIGTNARGVFQAIADRITTGAASGSGTGSGGSSSN